MNTKHTRGPWSDRNGRIFQTDREELTIANVGRAFDGDYSPANARLIAAAPDLLAALQDVLAMPDFDGTRATSIVRRDAKHAARAAIAKALGEPQ